MKNLLLIFAIGIFSNCFAQGCSDAGICSIGNGFQTSDKELKNGIEIGSVFGAGEADVTYFSPYITYTRTINERLSLSSKITYSVASGSFGQRGAFGDAYLIGNYNWKPKTNTQWSSLLGFKIPFTSSNLKINEFSLPLDYQSSLGTFDLIAGLNFNYKKWDFNTAVQIPVFNNNKNSYFKEFSGTDDFPSTNLFERKSDALFRTTYTFQTSNKKFTFKPNVLFIYHLGEDRFQNTFGQRETIKNSDGLTINGNLIGVYTINTKNSIELSLATPFVVREVRPDGLTREFTAGIIYKVSF
ncbi:hypothetical protein ACNQGB_17905 [Flavobacterium sp. XS1P32]|uniref:hypothetical protein n=1 Tax=unclassified Flavobacterium TaxID=196869 RepID=UPI003AAD086B